MIVITERTGDIKSTGRNPELVQTLRSGYIVTSKGALSSGVVPSTDHLLLESTGFRLLESGGKKLLG